MSQPSTESSHEDESVAKCVKFFKTLISLTQQNQGKYAPNAVDLVRSLIESVIGGSIKPEEFTNRLRDVLKSQTQPHLLPFIEKTLPALRTALLNGQQTIEGIRYTGHSDFVNSQPIQPNIIPLKTDSDSYEEKYKNYAPITKVDMEESQPHQVAMTSTTPSMPENIAFITLDARSIISRLVEQVPDCQGVEQEVIERISGVAESQLRELLIQLSEIAGHRLEPLKMNPMYKQISDPRKQLKYIEEYERQVFMRQETVEKEAVLKASKVKSKDIGLKNKEMKNANQEEKLQREANEAAITALGGHRNTKSWNRYDPMRTSIAHGINIQSFRPRPRRVTIRDLQCALNCKNVPGNAILKTHIAYGLFRHDENQTQQGNPSDTI